MKREAENCSQDDLPTKKNKSVSSRGQSLGLTEFINHGFSPITGELKSRMEDFLVTEINDDGTKCILNSFDIPERQTVERNQDTELVTLSDEVVCGLNQVIDGSLKVYSITAPTEKEQRTALHKSISTFNVKLSTETVKEEDISVIKVSLKKKGFHGHRDRERNKDQQFLHFTLLKWNMTTADTVLRISKLLKFKSSNLSYVGQKDKRGITSQRMCCRFGEPKRFAGLNKTFFEANKTESDSLVYRNNFLLGEFAFQKDDLKLGELSGNAFTVVLRDCLPTTEDNLEKIRTMLLENGFINYFGLQRFGNSGNTQDVGRFILDKDYCGAVKTILTPNNNHKDGVKQALDHYKDSVDAKSAFEMLKYKNCAEGILLGSLSKEPTDFKRALKSLHYKQQTLYAHAYQSYIWNKVVSKRIQCHGTQVLEGDLVQDEKNTVRKVSLQEMPKTQFSDVLLPLPGYDIVLPDNQCSDYLTSILAEDGMSLDTFRGPVGKEFNVSGCYRNIVFKPSDFTSEVLQYSDENEKLVLTNVDNIANKKFERENVGDKIAICLKFSLPKSSYATMLLREISRNDY